MDSRSSRVRAAAARRLPVPRTLMYGCSALYSIAIFYGHHDAQEAQDGSPTRATSDVVEVARPRAATTDAELLQSMHGHTTQAPTPTS